MYGDCGIQRVGNGVWMLVEGNLRQESVIACRRDPSRAGGRASIRDDPRGPCLRGSPTRGVVVVEASILWRASYERLNFLSALPLTAFYFRCSHCDFQYCSRRDSLLRPTIHTRDQTGASCTAHPAKMQVPLMRLQCGECCP